MGKEILDEILQEIDDLIKAGSSDCVEIKMGEEVYRDLWNEGKIKMRKFVVKGTGTACPICLPAYGDHAVWSDPFMGPYGVEVGNPPD